MDAIYPGSFTITKIKWGAKFDYEYVDNYKVLQNAFDKNGIKKHIDVDKLIKARYQDNLEFCQWIKRYFDLNYSGEPYNAFERRKGQNMFYIMGGNKVAAPTGGKQPAPARSGAGKTYSGKPTGQPSVGVPRVPRASGGGGAGSAELEAAVAKADEKNAELQMNNDTLDREREFYFGKLRDIEEML